MRLMPLVPLNKSFLKTRREFLYHLRSSKTLECSVLKVRLGSRRQDRSCVLKIRNGLLIFFLLAFEVLCEYR